MKNQIATTLKNAGYSVVCCNAKKVPIGRMREPLSGWDIKSFKELCDENIDNHESYCIRMGMHENGRTIVCLDFDVYNRNTDGIHEEVQSFLDNWREDSGDECLYSTGTEGNYAVLLDITDSPILLKEIEDLKAYNDNKSKIIAFGDLEILYGSGSCKVLPNSKTICKKNKKVRKSKLVIENGDTIFKVDDGYQWLINSFKEAVNDYKKKNPIKTKTTSKVVRTSTDDELYELADILSSVYYNAGEWNNWRSMMWACASIDNMGLAKYISSKQENWDEFSSVEAIEKLFEDYDDNYKKKITIGTFYHACKLSNTLEYEKIIAKYHQKKTDELSSADDTELAKLYLKLMDDNIIKSRNEIYIYQGCYWKLCEKIDLQKSILERLEAHYKTIKKNTEESLKVFTEKKEEDKIIQQEELLGFIKKLFTKIYSQRHQIDILKQVDMLVNHDNQINWDIRQPYYFSFKNATFDLKTNKIVEPKKTDYISATTGYDWIEPNEKDVKELEEVLHKILPLDDLYEGVLSVFRTGLFGIKESYLHTFKGSGGNGKSLVCSLIHELMGKTYAKEGDESIIVYPLKDGAPNVSASKLDKKRLATWEEPPTGSHIQSNNILRLTGNASISARGCFSNKDEADVKALTCILCLNHLPNIKGGVDLAIERRFKIWDFPSHFTSEEHLVDETLQKYRANSEYDSYEWKGKMKFALFKILLKSTTLKSVISRRINDYSKKVLAKSNTFIGWFLENYTSVEIPKENQLSVVVKVKDVFNKLKESEFYNLSSKQDKREKLSEKEIKNLIADNGILKGSYFDRKDIQGKNFRNILLGWEEIQIENDDSDCDDDEFEY